MTDTLQRVDDAARHLLAARRAGVAGPLLPDACRPGDIDTALAIQRRVVELSGEPVGGWKCALPPPGRVVVAPIFASTIRASGGPFRVVAGTPTVRIEPEIAFVLDHDLPPRGQPYSEDEVRGAIREVRLALEVLGCRYADPFKPLPWLVNFLAARGESVRAGQVVTTGSYAGAIDVPLGQPLTVRFGELGSLTVELVA